MTRLRRLFDFAGETGAVSVRDRRVLSVFGVLALAGLLALAFAVLPARADHDSDDGPETDPVINDSLGGEAGDCLAIEYGDLNEFRIENPKTDPDNDPTTQFDYFDPATGTSFDLNLNEDDTKLEFELSDVASPGAPVHVAAVIVKGGKKSTVLDYLGVEGIVVSHDDGLFAPWKGNLANENFFNISHVTFCYDVFAFSISGEKFHDRFLVDGSQGANEPGLDGWTIALIDADETVVTTNTANGGQYTFSNVELGTYTVCEILKDGWLQTAPTDLAATAACNTASGYAPNGYTVTVTNADVDGYDFGNVRAVTLACGFFREAAGNPVFDPATGDPTLLLKPWAEAKLVPDNEEGCLKANVVVPFEVWVGDDGSHNVTLGGELDVHPVALHIFWPKEERSDDNGAFLVPWTQLETSTATLEARPCDDLTDEQGNPLPNTDPRACQTSGTVTILPGDFIQLEETLLVKIDPPFFR